MMTNTPIGYIERWAIFLILKQHVESSNSDTRRFIMIKTTVKISGMACAMCEAHINDAVRGAFPVKKVTSSHSKGETVILSEEPLDEAAIRKTIDATGYTTGEITSAPYKKKGLFHFGALQI